MSVKLKKTKGSRQRPEAILIRPSAGKSYADVLGEIRRRAKPEENGAEIKALRKTRAGDLLVELGKSSGTSELRSDFQIILGENASVRVLESRTSLEVRDLDELTTEEEVTSAVISVLGSSPEMKVFVSRANSRGQKMAVLTMGAKDASKLLAVGHLKVGWVRARVRERLVAPRCFRCLGFGHLANHCRGPDRSKLCFRCGNPDHRASGCTSAESCVLCAEAGLKEDLIGHVAGSSRCGAYKRALANIRSSSRK